MTKELHTVDFLSQILSLEGYLEGHTTFSGPCVLYIWNVIEFALECGLISFWFFITLFLSLPNTKESFCRITDVG